MARPNWEYIRIDVLLPEHPKTDGLSDKAFRTLVELWCYCGRNRTDGYVAESRWQTFGSKAARDQLIERGFAELEPGGYLMHDYTGHQRSRAEIDELSERRAKAGRKGAASRWGA